MNNSGHRIRLDDGDRAAMQAVGAQYPGAATGGPPLKHEAPDNIRPEFNLLVAGCRGGKTSFLRLLLDTSVISPRSTKDQLASVAKFVQGSNGHTSYIRSASIDINVDPDGSGQQRALGLTLIDTPSLDFRDEAAAERLLSETLRHIDGRFSEGLEDEWKAQSGDRYVHLCIYFLDPDQIVPPSVPAPPAPLISRTRGNSFSQPDHEPVILEPPVTTNPLLSRPTLPQADITAIRRLSGRVNVLPVIARADILSNDRLAAVKLAIRRDLADAGIGFGIFDTDPPLPPAQDDHLTSANRSDSSNGYAHGPNGASSSNLNNTPPTSPTAPPILRLPYALISPDLYSHSDGVSRRLPSRHELVQQYTPSNHYSMPSPLPRGKFVRSYRWGNLDVLDPSHSDFLPLRTAIFHHMETLQKYTKVYLFEKFRSDYAPHQRPSPHHSVSHIPHMPVPQASRPILAIDTAPQPQQAHRHPVPVQQGHSGYPVDVRSVPAARTMPEPTPVTGSRSAPPRVKPRSKKITVACNFCRSRKLKCDGGRPTCSQCLKRNNPCDYMPQNKRRGTQRSRKGDETGSDSVEERSVEPDEPSLSPSVPSQTHSRRSSNVGRPSLEGYHQSLPSISVISERRDDGSLASSSRPKMDSASALSSSRTHFMDDDVPVITTLPGPLLLSPPTPVPMSAPNLPPLRPASELQAAQRKRAATVPGKSNRQAASSGPKVVACNFCRARKTKCDGAHPACASCARRQLDCNYAHDSSGPSGPGQRKARRPSTSKALSAESPRSVSPPSSRMIPTPSTAGNDIHVLREADIHLHEELDLKRPPLDYAADMRFPKKMRMDDHPAPAGIP